MPWPDEQLMGGETVRLRERQHPKTLIGPAAALVVVVVLAVIAATYTAGIPARGVAGRAVPWQTIANLVILVIAVLLVLGLTVRPALEWWATRFAVTSARITSRAGILVRRGEDIPLHRVTSVNVHQGITDRMFGCGTLVMESASERPLAFRAIPNVQEVHTLIYQAINDESEGASR